MHFFIVLHREAARIAREEQEERQRRAEEEERRCSLECAARPYNV